MSVSAWQKLDRAKGHFEILKSELGAWRKLRPYRSRRYKYLDGRHHGIILHIDHPPDLVRFSLIAGDCFHNLRCALDHLAYALAIAHSECLTAQQERNLQFPICGMVKDFPKQLSRISPLSPAAQTFIESVQPYHRRDLEHPSALRILSEANNIDKHRLLNVTQELLSSGEMKYTPIPGVSIDVEWCGFAAQDGAVVVRLVVDPPQLDMDYQCEFVIDIALRHTPVGQHSAPMTEILTLLHRAIAETEGILVASRDIQ